MGQNYLRDLVSSQKKGQLLGIYSACSVNPYVIQAVLRRSLKRGLPVLIEVTSNQVNQMGGYSGLTPAQVRDQLIHQAERMGLDPGQLILGGDHLGPNVWQKEPAHQAMEKASEMVSAYVKAGFKKIHLDASMRLGDDPKQALDPEISARRTADLCQVAESAFESFGDPSDPPLYVVGTEVPPPGGAHSSAQSLSITSLAGARDTLALIEKEFRRRSLEAAWERVIALVVQPGVEFGDHEVHVYQREPAGELRQFIETVPGIVYEAHSTDYQPPVALRQMVEDHFAILKVGPALTFAMREALFALELIEMELLENKPSIVLSKLQQSVEQAMLARPEYWENYYSGTPGEQRLARRFSLSDRIRYYWSNPQVSAAIDRLLTNLSSVEVPPGLVSQYFPAQFSDADFKKDFQNPREWIIDHIDRVLQDYDQACNPMP